MYTEYFGIDESPFSISPDPRYLYMSKRHQDALAHLLYGVGEGGGFVLLTGEVGTGKTTVCRCLLEQLPDSVDLALNLNPRMTEVELLASICDELAIDYPKGTESLKLLVDVLNRHLLDAHAKGRRSVLIIDEAQNLSNEVLEQVRLLTNLETVKTKLLQIILIGQPELNDVLAQKSLRQLAQRVTARCHLEPLGEAETKAYIRHRLAVVGLGGDVFGPRAIAEVYRQSGGVPRLINSVCDRCMLGAYTQNKKRIDRKMVRAAAREVFGVQEKPKWRRAPYLPWVTAAAGIAAGIVFVIANPLQLGIGSNRSGDLETVASASMSSRPAPVDVPVSEPAGKEEEKAGETTAAETASDSEETPVATTDGAPSAPASGDAPSAGETAETAETTNTGASPDDDAMMSQDSQVSMTGGKNGGTAEESEATSSETSARVVAVAMETGPEPADTVAPASGEPMETAEKTIEPSDEEQTTESEPEATPSDPSNNDAVAGEEPTSDQKEEEPETDVAAAATGLVKESPASTASITPDALFGDSEISGDLETALVTLFSRWNKDYFKLSGFAPCSRAKTVGLQCLQGKGTWWTLYYLNRPALITLTSPTGERLHGVVTAHTGQTVTIKLGGKEITRLTEKLTDYWSGEFLLLWNPPSIFRRNIRIGLKGSDVAWVKRRLAEIDGETPVTDKIATFDSKLKDKVLAFQGKRLIKKDGVVGVRTLIHLNTVGKASSTPLISDENS